MKDQEIQANKVNYYSIQNLQFSYTPRVQPRIIKGDLVSPHFFSSFRRSNIKGTQCTSIPGDDYLVINKMPKKQQKYFEFSANKHKISQNIQLDKKDESLQTKILQSKTRTQFTKNNNVFDTYTPTISLLENKRNFEKSINTADPSIVKNDSLYNKIYSNYLNSLQTYDSTKSINNMPLTPIISGQRVKSAIPNKNRLFSANSMRKSQSPNKSYTKFMSESDKEKYKRIMKEFIILKQNMQKSLGQEKIIAISVFFLS